MPALPATRRAVLTGAAGLVAGGALSLPAAPHLDAREAQDAINALAPRLERSDQMIIPRTLVEAAQIALDDDEQYENAAMREHVSDWKQIVSERLRRALAGEPILRAFSVDPDL